jgi:transposase-like protein
MYFDDGMTQQEIADELDCSVYTISNWFDKHGIETGYNNGDWTDKEVLKELYCKREMGVKGVAEELGCSKPTVLRWMEKFGIKTRKASWDEPPHFGTYNGYESWNTEVNGESYTVHVHRLVAVAEYGFDEVLDKEIHHKNEIKWDNRHENLIPMTKSDHMSHHHGSD